MPDNYLDDIGEPQDATTVADGVTNADGFHADVLYVGLNGCQIDSPEALGLSDEVAKEVAAVLSGDCKPIYLRADVEKEGCDIPEVVPVQTNVRFNGTMYVLANEGGYDLQQGQMLYNAFRDVCGEYPDVTMKAIGIEFKPTAKDSPTIMQARIEPSDLGELLLRVHIWQGNGQVSSIDGQTFLDLAYGAQILLKSEQDGGLKVLEAFSIQPPNQTFESDASSPSPDGYSQDGYSPDGGSNKEFAAYMQQDPGCSIPGGKHAPVDSLGSIFTLVAALWTMRQMRLQAGSKGTDVFAAIGKLLSSGEKVDKKE